MHEILRGCLPNEWYRPLIVLIPVIAAVIGAALGATGNTLLEHRRRSREHRLQVQEAGLEFIELSKETNRWNLEHAHSASTESKSRQAVKNARDSGGMDMEGQRRILSAAEQDRLTTAKKNDKFEGYRQQLKEQNRKLAFLAPDLNVPREALFKRATGHAPAGNPEARDWVARYRVEEEAFWEHLRKYVDLAKPTRRYKKWARRQRPTPSPPRDVPRAGA